MNENSLYEVKINRDQFSKKAKDLLLDNVEWYEVEEYKIYITMSQKQIDRMLKEIQRKGGDCEKGKKTAHQNR